MPVELHPAEKADLPVFYDILWESGKSNVLASLMWPNGYPVVSRDWSVDRAAENMRERPEIMKYMKVIDTDLPADDPLRQILGIAQWEVHAHDRTDEEVKADAERSKALGLPPGANPAFLEEFHGSVGQAQARHLGNKAHVYLHLLFTHPDRFRQGAGSMHLQWGLELADKVRMTESLWCLVFVLT